MAANQTTDFKKPLWIIKWLDTALEKEKEKYRKCPIVPDMVPGHDAAQGWGYVVAGYFLLEQSFKALLYVRTNEKVPKIHSLSKLFVRLDDQDKDILREYYNDYQATIGGMVGKFPIKSLDQFLENLDGDDHVGSFDWRYFLTEEKRSQKMPLVSGLSSRNCVRMYSARRIRTQREVSTHSIHSFVEDAMAAKEKVW